MDHRLSRAGGSASRHQDLGGTAYDLGGGSAVAAWGSAMRLRAQQILPCLVDTDI